jgi:hypothetical protein
VARRAAEQAAALRDGQTARIQGQPPVEVKSDGTQVFAPVPGQVRQPDGSVGTTSVTISAKPGNPVPVFVDPKKQIR